MPRYDFLCQAGHKAEHFMRVADYNPKPSCPVCGVDSNRVWSVPKIMVYAFSPGWDHCAGRVFHDMGERKQWLKQNNLFEYGAEDMARNRQELKDGREERKDAWRETRDAKAAEREALANECAAKGVKVGVGEG